MYNRFIRKLGRWPGFALLLFAMCTQPPPASKPGSVETYGLCGLLPSYTATGKLEIRMERQETVIDISVVHVSPTRYTLDFYGPMGTLVATIGSDSSGMWVRNDQEQRMVEPSQPVSDLVESFEFPFTVKECLNIFSGLMPDCSKTDIDSSLNISDVKTAIKTWKTGTTTITETARRSSDIEVPIEVTFTDPAWFMRMSNFMSGVAKKVEFRNSSGNGFHLAFERIIF